MSALRIDELPWPTDEFRIDLHSKNFESENEVELEDAKRAKRLRKTALGEQAKRAAELLDLANLLDPLLTPQKPITLASSRYLRELRIRVIGALWRLVDDHGDINICRYDIAKPSWARSPHAFRNETAIGFKAKLRADLLRSADKLGFANVSNVDGFLLALLHGELTQFDDNPEHIHPHFHLIAGGNWIAIAENMRKQPGYQRNPYTVVPIRASRTIQDIPYALSYLLKSYWPATWRGTVSNVGRKRRTRDHRRMPEPHHSDVLLWLHKTVPSDLLLKMGIHLNREGFRMKNN